VDFKKHGILSALALAVGVGLVWWLQPTTSGGTVLVIVICFFLFNAIGALLRRN
jgi:hypothetical protein